MDQTLEFLNCNAGAIQALTAVLTLVVTTVLAVITWCYVVLTRSIAATANEELDLKRQENTIKERGLLLLLARFQERIAALPYDESKKESIKRSISWEMAEIESVRTIGVALGRRTGEATSHLSDHLQFIKEQIDLVRSFRSPCEIEWGGFSWDLWRAAISHASSDIVSISQLIEMDKKGY